MRLRTLPGPELQTWVARSISGEIDLIKRLHPKDDASEEALTKARESLRVAQRYLEVAKVADRQG